MYTCVEHTQVMLAKKDLNHLIENSQTGFLFSNAKELADAFSAVYTQSVKMCIYNKNKL